jgi:hypothetical protein
MTYYSVEFSSAMIALLLELSRRISLYYPTLKPYLLSGQFAGLILPTKRALTRTTPPPLLSIIIKTILFNRAFVASRTLFFSSFLNLFKIFFKYYAQATFNTRPI